MELILQTYHNKLKQACTKEKSHKLRNVFFNFVRFHQININMSEKKLMEDSIVFSEVLAYCAGVPKILVKLSVTEAS